MNFTVPSSYTNPLYSTSPIPNGTIFYPTISTIPYTTSPSITLSQNTYDPRFNPLFMSPSVVHCQSPRNNIVYSPTTHSLPAPCRRLSAEPTNEDQLPPPPPVWRSSPIHHRTTETPPPPPPPPTHNYFEPPPPPPYRSASPPINTINISPRPSPAQLNWDHLDSPPNPYVVAPSIDYQRSNSPSPIPSGLQSDTSPEAWDVRDPQRVLDEEYSPPYVPPAGANFTSPPEATWGPDRGFGTTRRQRRRTSSSNESSPPTQDESCGLTETSPSEVTETSSCPPDFTPHELSLRVVGSASKKDMEITSKFSPSSHELANPKYNVQEKKDHQYSIIEPAQSNKTTNMEKPYHVPPNEELMKPQITNNTEKSHQLSNKDLAFIMLNKKLQETENEAAQLRAQLEALTSPMPPPVQIEQTKFTKPIIPPLALPPMAPQRATTEYNQNINTDKRWNPDTKIKSGRRSSSPTVSPRYEIQPSVHKRSSSPTISNKKIETHPQQGRPIKPRSSSPSVKQASSNIVNAKRAPSPSPSSINSARNSTREKQNQRSTSPSTVQPINKSSRSTSGIKTQRTNSIQSSAPTMNTPRSLAPTPRTSQQTNIQKHSHPTQPTTENADHKWKRKAPVPRLSVMVRRGQSPSTRITPKDIQEVNVISPSPCSASLLSLPSVDPAAEVADWAARVELCGMEGVLLDDTPISSTCPVIPHPPPLPRLPNFEPVQQTQLTEDLCSEADEEEKLREKLQLKLQLERQLQLQLQEHQQLQMRLQLEEVRQKLRSLQQPVLNSDEGQQDTTQNNNNSFTV